MSGKLYWFTPKLMLKKPNISKYEVPTSPILSTTLVTVQHFHIMYLKRWQCVQGTKSLKTCHKWAATLAQQCAPTCNSIQRTCSNRTVNKFTMPKVGMEFTVLPKCYQISSSPVFQTFVPLCRWFSAPCGYPWVSGISIKTQLLKKTSLLHLNISLLRGNP